MRPTALKNRTGRMIAAATIIFCMTLGATPSQAADRVVVIPMGKSGAPAPVAKTGQTTSYRTSDDGDLEKGVSVTPASARFKDNGNGTVTDSLTGLIWLKNGQCLQFFSTDTTGLNYRPWADAIDAVNNLASGYCGLLDGSKAGDWRLPNRKELDSLLDIGHSYPALPADCPLSTFASYWSSTTNVASTGRAWLVDLQSGDVFNAPKSDTYYVRAVRGGQ